MKALRRSHRPFARCLAGTAVFALSLLSCGREITGPNGPRYARGMSFVAQFPSGFASLEQGAGSVVAFTKVRVFFRRMDGSVALDRMVSFPEGTQELSLSFDVPLSQEGATTGEELNLFLRYVNATGDTVFAGGPVVVFARPSRDGSQAPPPATVPLNYTGPGANATGVIVSPDTIVLVSGATFSVTAAAHDAQQAPVPSAPLVWSVLDPTKASLTSMSAGNGTTLPSRGWARIRVALAAGGGADTAYLNILPKPGTLAVLGGANQTATVSAVLPDSIRLRVNATDDLPLQGATVRFAVTTGGGSVSADSVVSDSLGRVAVRWTLGSATGTQTLTATLVGGTAPTVISATAEAGTVPALQVTQQPAADTAGAILAPIIAEVRDGQNVLVTDFADTVSIAINTGPPGGTLSGRSKAVAVGGVVTLDSLRLTVKGSYVLTLSGPGVQPANTNAFSISAGTATSFVVESGNGQTAAPGAALADTLVLALRDAFANGVTGVTIEVVGTPPGTVAPTSAPTDASGRARFTWTLGTTPGAQLVTFRASGSELPDINATATASTGGGIVSTDVTPAADTLVSIGEQVTFVARAYDAQPVEVPGSFTWSSSAPAVATVDSAGRVTAVANGSAWIIAVEAGGTRDSAQVVVNQLLASVLVTPGTRQLYLGTTFDFNAQAVDGLGVPMATQPTFTWSTQSVAIALVDTAGLVTTVGLGGTQVQATAGAVTGVANLTVVTPITRIAVVRDSIGFVTTDTFTLVALQRPRSYRAVAYDTLDVAMTGVNFTFTSSNPSVAALDSTGTQTARARALANGLTEIRAAAQGKVGAARLTVQQVLADIALSPSAATIAPTGNTLLTARGLDPDGFFLPSLSGVSFVSLNTGIASVNATTGLVTGIANGTALITASKDAINADTATITVGGAVPAIISFGRDSLAIGRAGSQSIPIYLSRPHTGPLTVNLAVADTFAFFSTASITIAAGSTSGNATLNGRNAGSTRIFATDGSAAGYAGDTAILAVQANVRFSTTSYGLVANTSQSTQVLLSDPSPAGGTFITYQYGTPGRLAISPDPAFIPAGQLSANVVFTALSGGGTTVTPSATGVTGQTANVTTYPAVLDVPFSLVRMPNGTYNNNIYVQVGASVPEGLPLTMRSTDTSVVRVASETGAIPPGTYYHYFGIRSAGLGSAYVVVSAAGFTPDSFPVEITAPVLDACCDATRETTSPNANLGVSVRDVFGNTMPRIAPLVVNLASSDTNLVRPTQATATVPANGSSVSFPYAVVGNIGSAWIRVTAAGHATDSVRITVNGPKLNLSILNSVQGVGQRNSSIYVYLPNNTTVPRVVRLQNSNPAAVALPDSVIIPVGIYYAYFTADGLTNGNTTVIASTPGHEPDTARIFVSPTRLAVSGGGIIDNFRPPFNINVGVRDSVGNAFPRIDSLPVTWVSSDTTVLRITPTVTIAGGQNSTSAASVTVVGAGTAWLRASAAGHSPDSVSYTVRVPKLSFSFATYTLGRRQTSGSSALYVSVPNNVTDTLPVTITRSNPTVDSLPLTSPNIPAGIYYRYFSLVGLTPGVDTLIASAPGYLPDTAIVRITSVRFNIGGLPATRTTTDPPSGLSVSVADSLGNVHPTIDTVVVRVVSSNPAVLQPVLPSYRILPGQQSVTTQVAYVGPGSGFITVSDSLGSGYAGGNTNTVTVSGPSLFLTNGNPTLGMRQNNGGNVSYVYVQNNVTGQPLTVRLLSSDPSVASVPDSVVIPVGIYYAYFQVTAHDVIGTVQIQATAVGYAPTSMNQEVTAPRFLISAPTSVRTTSALQTVTVRAADAGGTVHPVNEPVVVNLASSSIAIGTIDSASVTIPAGSSQNNTARFRALSEGSTQLSATDPRSESFRYATGTVNVSVVTPLTSFGWSGTPVSLAVGQYTDDYYVQVQDNATSPLTVNLTRATGNAFTADTVTINAGIYYRYFRISGASLGVDTLRATVAGHLPSGPGPVNVGLGRVDGISGWPTTLATDSVQVTLRTRAPDTSIRSVLAATTFTLGVTGNLQFVSGGASSAVITSVTVPANGNSVSFWMKRLAGGGTATVTISATNYTTYVSTVNVSP